jgi:pyrimidine-nucleoside phosphorylase
VNFLRLIELKRDDGRLSSADIREFIDACVAGKIPDYQLAAFLMAVYFRGLDDSETTALTLAMRDSGDVLQFHSDDRLLVDKHSTGGVGDKVSLPLAPLLACLGFRVPMISGRGLGITGGTLDKLDSIPGFKTSLEPRRIIDIVQSVGCVICGQTARMAPADKILYSLRDVTGTVPSIPLIVASILSKKLAEGLDALVLDVKFGAAAFLPAMEKARELAQAMVTLGNQCGVKTEALLTNMDSPLGRACGNWLEIREAVQCLSGKGPEDLQELVVTCAARLLVLTGKAPNPKTGREKVLACLQSEKPLAKWEEMLAAHGADMDAYRRKLAQPESARAVVKIPSPSTGRVTSCNARILGEIVRDLGGGRLTKESVIDYEVGFDQIMKPGEPAKVGSILARLHGSDRSRLEAEVKRAKSAFTISESAVPTVSLIAEIIQSK